MVPHDSYSRYDKNISTANKVETRGEQRVNTTVLANKVKRMAQMAVNMRKGPEMKADKVRQALNESLGHLPKCVMMLGAEYTPMELQVLRIIPFMLTLCWRCQTIGSATLSTTCPSIRWLES